MLDVVPLFRYSGLMIDSVKGRYSCHPKIRRATLLLACAIGKLCTGHYIQKQENRSVLRLIISALHHDLTSLVYPALYVLETVFSKVFDQALARYRDQ